MIVEHNRFLKPRDREAVSRRLGDYLGALPAEGLDQALKAHQDHFVKKRRRNRRPEQLSLLSEKTCPSP